jgi:hypothetical protein
VAHAVDRARCVRRVQPSPRDERPVAVHIRYVQRAGALGHRVSTRAPGNRVRRRDAGTSSSRGASLTS